MSKPLVGVIGSTNLLNDRHLVQMTGERNMRAIKDVAGAIPMMFAGTPEITDVADLIEAVDGVLLTGGRANVHPTRFGVEPHPAHEPYDELRDAVALAVTRACVEQGVPIFGVCRGLQEMNVAFGGTLQVESIVGEGTVVRGTLPLHRPSDPETVDSLT